MRYFFLFLLFLSLTFSLWQGVVEKRWRINATPWAESLDFQGFFLASSPYQQFKIIHASENVIIKESNDTTVVLYHRDYPETENEILLSARVNVSYFPKITFDPPLPPFLPPKDEISSLAVKLRKNGTLATVVAIVDFISRNIQYDGNSPPKTAEETWKTKRATCVGFSNLLKAMLESLGIKSKLVYGYLYTTEGWQPHTWVAFYLPDYGWVEADAVTREVGFLSEKRVAMKYGETMDEMQEYLRIKKGNANIDSFLYFSEENASKRRFVTIVTNHTPYTYSVVLKNPTPYYLILSYSLSLPKELGRGHDKLLLLSPWEKKILVYNLSYNDLKPGYLYYVNVSLSINDEYYYDTFEIVTPEKTLPKRKKEKDILSLLFDYIYTFLSSLGFDSWG